jgi:hypothetical protein
MRRELLPVIISDLDFSPRARALCEQLGGVAALSAAQIAALEDVIRRQRGDPRFSVPRSVSRAITGDGETKQLKLERTGEVEAFPQNGRWQIVTATSYGLVARRILAPAKPRTNRTTFKKAQKRPPPRTPKQIEALRQGRAHKRELQRREESETA